MLLKNYKTVYILILILVITSISCVITGSGNSELQNMQTQLDALSTQNASLLELLDSENNNENIIELDAPSPPTDKEDNQIIIAEPTLEALPDTPVPAGTPIIYDGWSMTVSRDIDVITRFSKTTWGITIYVRNMNDTSRIFRFMNSGVTAYDDLGNVYQFSESNSLSNRSCESVHHDIKNIQIGAEKSQTITAYRGVNNQCTSEYGIHPFDGVIPLEAKHLIIRFNNFGPFNDVEVFIDL